MTQMDKIRVAVLYGGRSAEHEVSLRSAANVIQYLDASRFDVIPIGIDKQGKWFLGKETFAHSLEQTYVSRCEKDTHTWFAPEWVGTPISEQQLTALSRNKISGPQFDVIFPAVHGTFCEDGTLQGLLEMADLPYVGCGVLSSSVGMDKDISKRLVMEAGVNVSPYVVIKQGEWKKNSEKYLCLINEKLTYPLFVKPANTGSSIGIHKVKSSNQLLPAINDAFKYDTKILGENGLNVIELEVAVRESLEDGAEPIASVVGEIRPAHEFYSYKAKYLDDNGADLLIPAAISEDIQTQVQSIAKKIFTILDCEGMARVDLFLDKDSQKIYFNEVNTLPGFTQISMYPKLMAASGIAYSALLTHLVELAMKRHKNKKRLVRNYVE